MRNDAAWRGRALLGAALCASYLLLYWPLTACKRPPTEAREPPRALRDALVVVIGPAENHPQWPGIRGGAERFFAAVPSLRSHCTAPTAADAESLLAAVTRVLEWHPAVVCLYVTDPAATLPCIDLIARRDILIVTLGTPFGDPRITGHIGVDLAAACELLGANLSRVAAGRRSYLLLHEQGRTESDTNCCLRFRAAAQRQHDITLLQEANAADGAASGAQLAEDMLGLFPNAGLFVMLNPEVWWNAPPGWHRRLRELNQGFRFTTLSAAPALWPYLGTPESPGEAAALVGPLDGEIGYAAAQLATQLLISTERLRSRITVPCEVVTPENLADFARRYSESANGLDVSGFLPAAAR